ncbi:HD domain-containing phosphohydrolase [Marinitoga sp. 1155]|uniref:HD domain-containing phosphohydrolase n=1 Tax=Marinitoga sp. 1155 TaxID=1428448 RepID=UPI000A07C24C|nr:HD domain-containing phosphohydrolase [Marinitoga sp. 1155]
MNYKINYLLFIIFFIITTSFSENLIIGVYNNPPLTYYENNEYSGFVVDLISEISKREKWKITYKFDAFDSLYKDLKEGKIDILVDIAYSKDREKDITFNNETVFANWGILYTNDGNFNSILDLRYKPIAVVKDDIYYTGKDGIKNLSKNLRLHINFLEYSSYKEVLEAVKRKVAYAGVVSRTYNGKVYNLQKTSISFFPVDIKYGFKKDIDPNIIQIIDHYLNKWKDDESSIYYKLLNKYFLNITNEIPQWIFWILFIGIFILFITLLMIYIYRKSLLKATKELREKNEKLESTNEELIAITEELEDLYKKNEEFSNNIMKMIEIMSNLKPSNSINEFYKQILDVAISIIPEVDYGSIILIDIKKKQTKFIAARGHDINKLKKIKSLIGNIPNKENIRIVKNILYTEKSEYFSEKDIELLLKATVPIKETLVKEIQLNKDLWIKISLDIDKSSNKHFSENSFKLLDGFGNLIKAFWMEKSLTREVKNAYLRFATKLSIIAEAHDDITGNHIYRVGKISRFIGEKFGLNEEKLEEIESFAPLHDIGKIFTDRSLLRKTESLSDEEFEEIKMHTIYAVKLLDDPYFETAKNIALYHHEKYDGSGYPFGLKNGEIPIEAQIVSLADIYDALRSERTYKKGFSHETAYRIITEGDGRVEPSHFHPKILVIFKQYHLEIKEIYDSLSSKTHFHKIHSKGEGR